MKNKGKNNFYLGLDLGSVSLNCIIIDNINEIIYKRYKRTSGRPVEKALELLAEMKAELGSISFAGAVVTGSGKELIAESTKIDTINEIIAHGTAAWTIYPDVKNVFEIGGQDSKYISIGRNTSGSHYLKDHAFNELCAAGTGAFLDQQADRLGLSINELGCLAESAKAIANVAGRCSVFAKSDMIHLQQKAVPVEEIASGLCFALARNFLATLCRGHIPSPPILFQGGVAANRGVAKAFREILQLNKSELIIPDNSAVMGALGCAIIAGTQPLLKPLSIETFTTLLVNRKKTVVGEKSLQPLKKKSTEHLSHSQQEPVNNFQPPFFLGLDIGSVSTKGVVIDSDKHIVSSSYIPTAGRPVESLNTVLSELTTVTGQNTFISHVVSTGSGRHISAALLGGGTIIDEISTQFLSAKEFFPDVDTVIEIGGQDSKYIQISNGRIESFKMNRACAAGTGAFLEEQAGRLKIKIENEFSEKAFKSTIPVKLGNRCTVFMDSDLVHHLQRGASTEDLCAGLAYSIGENYFEKVVGSSQTGDSIIFQGGVAKNSSVCAAFEQLSGKTIKIHPYPEISGALGAAFAGRDEYLKDSPVHSFHLNNLRIQAETETFDCKLCDNFCEIRKISVPDGKTAYFGSVCGRFEKSFSNPVPANDPFVIREQLLHDHVLKSENKPFRGKIGIPLTLTMFDHLPFWGTFFNLLGFETVFSTKTNRSIIEDGLIHVPAEFCYPIKVLFGHVYDLSKEELETLFIPHLRLFTPPDEKTPRYACPYTQAAPYIVRENVPFSSKILTLEFPVEGESKHWADCAAQKLGINKKTIKNSLESALTAQDNFANACIKAGEKIISCLKDQDKRGAVLIGRPYNTADRYVNLNLARKLKKLNIEPIPYDFLPPDKEPLPELWSRIRWGYGRKLIQSVRVLKKHKFLGAVIVTNFGCGPDSFIDQYLEYELRDTPNILIEYDDHQAEAGLVTRLEAFSRNFEISRNNRETVKGKDPGKPRIPLREYTYYIPSFMDHAYAITGALKASGCKTILLPPSDDESWNLGHKHAYGRECHPFISFTGDILKAAQHPDFDPKKACYYGPSYFGPCLLPQYQLALHLILERIGLGDITVMNIADDTNMKELGTTYMIRIGFGMYAIDRFFKWKTEIEPYEKIPGQVCKIYNEILKEIEKGISNNTFFRTVKKCAKKFKTIALTENNGALPKIGIVGDVYTRINEYSNNKLYKRLKDMGYEVWPASSFIDVSFLGAELIHEELMRKGKKTQSITARSLIPGVKFSRWLVDRYFPETIRTPQERDYHAVSKVSDRYSNLWIDKALSLNLNRVEELYLNQADGVINVMCHNCMLGNITSSLTKSMRKDMGDIPICNLVYEGLKSTHNVNRLEAFIHQVNSHKNSSINKE